MTYKQNKVIEMPKQNVPEACEKKATKIAPTFEELSAMLAEIENVPQVNLLEIALLAQEMSLVDKTSGSIQLARDKEEIFPDYPDYYEYENEGE